jgi:hypothetical protein
MPLPLSTPLRSAVHLYTVCVTVLTTVTTLAIADGTDPLVCSAEGCC